MILAALLRPGRRAIVGGELMRLTPDAGDLMTESQERLRPHPSARLAGPVVALNLPDLARALHGEPHPSVDGHRQAGLAHRGSLRVILFAFEPGGRLPRHRAPGHVMIHCLRGALEVEAAGGSHQLGPGEAVLVDPEVSHSVVATEESDMLLTVSLDRETA